MLSLRPNRTAHGRRRDSRNCTVGHVVSRRAALVGIAAAAACRPADAGEAVPDTMDEDGAGPSAALYGALDGRFRLRGHYYSANVRKTNSARSPTLTFGKIVTS